jgi:non-heme chloroperoxidase
MYLKNYFNNSNYFLTEDGNQLFYTTNFQPDSLTKNDECLIFNYGLACSNFHWRFQLPFFHHLGYKILIHDYRGHYQSTLIKQDTLTFENIANDIYKIAQSIGIESAHIIGHSMGVNVSLELLRKFPSFINSLTLISGTIMPVDNIMFDTNAMEFLRPLAFKIFSHKPNLINTIWKYGGWNPVMRKFIKFSGFNQEQISEEFIEVYLNKMGILGPNLFFQLLDQMQRQSVLPFMANVKIPSLIMGGDNDKVIPNHLQKLLHKKLNKSELYIFKNGSHVPQADFPDITNRRIYRFLNSISGVNNRYIAV